jgi:short-subunit dehydrogenase
MWGSDSSGPGISAVRQGSRRSVMSKVAFITGASSGIGASLARELAARGYTLGLFARRLDLLEQLAAEIRLSHPVRVDVAVMDVCDQASVPGIVDAMREKLGGLDIIVANAGITGVRKSGSGDLAVDRRIFETNVMGAIATLDAAVPHFKAQGGGTLVGISSVASFFGIPGSAAYSASKAALSNYLDGMGKELSKYKITVTTILPGFVETDLAPGMGKYPMVVKPEKVAKEIADAIERGAKTAVVPRFPWAALVPTLKLVPDALMKRIF